MSANNQEIHDTNLQVASVEGVENALKSFVLFTTINDEVVIALNSAHLHESFDYINKHSLAYKIVFLDDKSYELLYTKTVEVRADKRMSDIATAQENTEIDDEDYSVTDFLKTNSDIMTSEESAPIIKFVNSLFYQAIKKKASDIHIEMHEFKGEIRYRVDGVLTKHIELDKNIMALVISRIKVISNLDISEKRIPQDGRTQIKISGTTLDIRVSILPNFFGERVVMRILMQSDSIPTLQELGLSEEITEQLANLSTHSHGMILVTGPTGSGKSTTLHALLQSIYSPEKNIITVEDPVEYKSDHINQIQTNAKVGLTFASGLRSILRQDPDIIMVGEIRDIETAQISVQAALTGHLVFSTLHTNRAPSALTRLMDMEVEKFLISSSVLGVLAQRLVRLLCDNCKILDKISPHDASTYGLEGNVEVYKAVGCEKCSYTGYSARKAIAELFIVNDAIKEALKHDVDDTMLMKLAVEHGMVSLSAQLAHMIKLGVTSLDEAIRIGIND